MNTIEFKKYGVIKNLEYEKELEEYRIKIKEYERELNEYNAWIREMENYYKDDSSKKELYNKLKEELGL